MFLGNIPTFPHMLDYIVLDQNYYLMHHQLQVLFPQENLENLYHRHLQFHRHLPDLLVQLQLLQMLLQLWFLHYLQELYFHHLQLQQSIGNLL
jgi:hypothetical protein